MNFLSPLSCQCKTWVSAKEASLFSSKNQYYDIFKIFFLSKNQYYDIFKIFFLCIDI